MLKSILDVSYFRDIIQFPTFSLVIWLWHCRFPSGLWHQERLATWPSASSKPSLVSPIRRKADMFVATSRKTSLVPWKKQANTLKERNCLFHLDSVFYRVSWTLLTEPAHGVQCSSLCVVCASVSLWWDTVAFHSRGMCSVRTGDQLCFMWCFWHTHTHSNTRKGSLCMWLSNLKSSPV